MKAKFVMTAFGKDRCGFVSDVTRLLFENGCNLEDSQMIRMEDEFVIVLLFTGERESVEKMLPMEVRRLERERGISVFFRAVESKAKEYDVPGALHSLHVEGPDHAGIVHKISQYLADKEINIESMGATIRPSPETGADLYDSKFVINIPEGVSVKAIDDDLDDMGDELHVEITRETVISGSLRTSGKVVSPHRL
jgi:glycine cleavage system transcriptional repressor